MNDHVGWWTWTYFLHFFLADSKVDNFNIIQIQGTSQQVNNEVHNCWLRPWLQYYIHFIWCDRTQILHSGDLMWVLCGGIALRFYIQEILCGCSAARSRSNSTSESFDVGSLQHIRAPIVPPKDFMWVLCGVIPILHPGDLMWVHCGAIALQFYIREIWCGCSAARLGSNSTSGRFDVGALRRVRAPILHLGDLMWVLCSAIRLQFYIQYIWCGCSAARSRSNSTYGRFGVGALRRDRAPILYPGDLMWELCGTIGFQLYIREIWCEGSAARSDSNSTSGRFDVGALWRDQ
jgi:hypothetical protein